jgi:hypothetical protein
MLKIDYQLNKKSPEWKQMYKAPATTARVSRNIWLGFAFVDEKVIVTNIWPGNYPEEYKNIRTRSLIPIDINVYNEIMGLLHNG